MIAAVSRRVAKPPLRRRGPGRWRCRRWRFARRFSGHGGRQPVIAGALLRRRIFRLYGELKYIETQLESRDPKAALDDLRIAMDRLELRANHMRTPSAFAHMLYTLRLHVRMVRERLERRQAQ